MRKLRSIILTLLAASLFLYGCNININITPAENNSDITILFTNDVHCGVDGDIGYAGLVAYKKEMEQAGNSVLLVDDGDEVQGGVIGTLTKGEAIVKMMNEVGYDIVIPGNHDFDYGTDRYLELTNMMDFPVICCNFMDLRTGKNVFDPYIIKTVGSTKIAFIGVTTPTTITSSAPAYFQDDNKQFIYGFCQGNNGKNLYDTVQKAVDDAKVEGADYTVLISHLGIDEDDSPYMSTDLIKNTAGIDVVLDGHSHSVVEMDVVKNRDGEDVILSQTGYKLANIGKLTITPDGNIKTELIGDYTAKDPDITRKIEDAEAVYREKLDKAIGKTEFDMMATYDDEYTWRVRNSETNMGDFVADAYRYATGAEAAFVNGGGVRDNIRTGNITYEDLININPFSNALCIRKVTGQELADALEYSTSEMPDNFGGFLQVSGITFDVDTNVQSQVILDENGMFNGFNGAERRVSNIKVNDEPLDPDREYEIASIDYILFNNGNGYTMFKGDRVDLERYIEDIDALIEYTQSFNGEIPDEYRNIEGQGRIKENK